MSKANWRLLAVLLALAPLASVAQERHVAASVDAAQRRAVVAELGKQLQAHYVFPEIAKRVALALKKKEAGGGYAWATDSDAFSKALTADLRDLGQDLHFRVMYEPQFRNHPDELPQDAVPDPAEVEHAKQIGFGVESVQRLPGNVGYLEMRGFGPAELVADGLSAAMLLLSGTDALILDLRRNRGGDPAGVSYLLSHFFALGDERHLNDIYNREDDETRQYWTQNSVLPRYLKPIYVLTSSRTFSGGEECAYDLQTQKRATLVGETTGGAANPGGTFTVGEGFVAFISNAKSINPITRTSWEHTGVKPDIAVAAADARQTAHVAILRGLIDKAQDPEEQAALLEALAEVEGKKMAVGR